MSIGPQRASAARLASACAAVGTTGMFVAAAIVAAGGGVARLRVVTVGFKSPWPALGIGIAFTLAAWWVRRRVGASTTSAAPPLAARPPGPAGIAPGSPFFPTAPAARAPLFAALAIALCCGVAAWAYGTESAAGADASGYLNAAKLFAAGSTSVAQPLADGAPWPDALRTMAPLGFRAGRAPLALVPTYPPGLPLLLAVAMRLHARAWPVVVPALAATAVFVTFLLGARLVSPRAALVAACGVAASPVFLFHAVQPMSDVPTTAWWTLAWLCALPRTRGWHIASGLATGAAIVTRPNLAPLALVALGLVFVAHRRVAPAVRAGEGASATMRPGSAAARRRAVTAFLIAVLPAVVFTGWLNDRLYGHPLQSGYGSAADLFSLAVVRPNLARYAEWVADVHPVAAMAAALSLVVWLARWRSRARAAHGLWPDTHPAFVALAGVVVLNVGAYLVYAPFENWTYLRFLLPSFPLVAIAAASAIDRAVSSVPRVGTAGIVTAALCGVIVGLGIRDASARGVFERRSVDARHETIARAYQPRAASLVFVTQQHSGAVLFYTGAPVLRWDLIDPAALDGALAWLTARGLTPVILVDADEEPVFRARFVGRGAWARLDWPARLETVPPQRARAYELPDRARYDAGEVWSRRLLTPPRR